MAVANGPFYGAGFTVARDARWDDGRLTVRVFEEASLAGVVWHFLNVARHRLPRAVPGQTFRARRVRVSPALAGARLAVHADGRPAGTAPVQFEAQAGALTVLAPQHPA